MTEFNIKGVSKAELHFGNYIVETEARGGSPLILYPLWDIVLYFDKLYPGNVYGLWIKIWADTGKVSKITPMMWMEDHPPPENGANNGEQDAPQVDNKMQTLLIICIALISLVIVLAVALVYPKYKKRGRETLVPKNKTLQKQMVGIMPINSSQFPHMLVT